MERLTMRNQTTNKAYLIDVDDDDVQDAIQKLCDYEDLEEQGLLKIVVRGEWIFKYDGAYGKRRAYCSACGKRSGIGGIIENQMKPYCPNCGAEMKLKEMEGES